MSCGYFSRQLAAVSLLAAAAGCASSTEPLLGPVGVRVIAESVSRGALLPVRLRTQDGGDWFVNPCGYRFELLIDDEWMRPYPLPEPCSEQPNVAVQAGSGTILHVPVPDYFGPGTYRIVYLVNLGTPLDKPLYPVAEQLYVGSNRFRVLP